MSGYTNDLSTKSNGELVLYKTVPAVVIAGKLFYRGQCSMLNYWNRRFWQFGDELGCIVGSETEAWIPVVLQCGCNYGIKPHQRILVVGRTLEHPEQNTRRYDKIHVPCLLNKYINICFNPRWLVFDSAK